MKIHVFYSFLLKSLFSSKEDIYIYIRKHQSQKINRIYQSFLFNLFKNDFTIKIGKEDIQLAKPFETVLVLESNGVWNSNIV